MKEAENANYQYQSKEVYRWSDEINRLHVEVRNPRKSESEVTIYRLGPRDKSSSATRKTMIPPEETHRFVVSKSEPEETGVVICHEPNLKIRISESSDGGDFQTELKESERHVQMKQDGLREKLKYSLPWQQGLPSWMSKHVVYPTYLKLKGLRTLEFLKELEVSQAYDPEEMQALQLRKLKQLLKYCQTHVPYYQEVFDSVGFRVEDLKTLDDIQLLPFLEKKTVAENPEKIKTNSKNLPFYESSTSGSTGLELSTFKDYDTVAYNFAAKFRAERWWNLDYGLREAWFWARGFTKPSLRLRTGDWLFRNKIVLEIGNLTSEIMYDYYKRLLRFKPDILYVNPSAGVIFTQFLEENNLDISMLDIKAVICATEVLHDYQRQYFQSVYRCPVMNEYGASEVGIVAKECPKNNMHLVSENVIVEIIKDGERVGPNEFGEIVVTNLNNRMMPAIRYKIGDVGRLIAGECGCGVKLPLFDVTIGRDCDSIILEDRELPGAAFFAVLGKELTTFVDGGLRCYKIYQKDLRNFLFQAVLKESGLEQKLVKRAREIVRETLGENVSFEFEFVDHIPRESSGKLRYFVSEVLKR